MSYILKVGSSFSPLLARWTSCSSGNQHVHQIYGTGGWESHGLCTGLLFQTILGWWAVEVQCNGCQRACLELGVSCQDLGARYILSKCQEELPPQDYSSKQICPHFSNWKGILQPKVDNLGGLSHEPEKIPPGHPVMPAACWKLWLWCSWNNLQMGSAPGCLHWQAWAGSVSLDWLQKLWVHYPRHKEDDKGGI